MYPEIIFKLEDIINNIEYSPWSNLKARFIFAKNSCGELAKNHSQKPSLNQMLLEIFFDKVTDLQKLVKKHTDTYWVVNRLCGTSRSIVNEIKNEAFQTPDSQFVKYILQDDKITSAFCDKYVNWRKESFLKSVKKVLPKNKKSLQLKLNHEFYHKKHELENCEITRICSDIKNRYSEGDLLVIKDIEILGKALFHYDSMHTQKKSLKKKNRILSTF